MNKFYFLLYPLFNFCACTMMAQDMTSEELINAWNISDVSQTIRAEETYKDLRINKDLKKFKQRIKELNNYLTKHPDERIYIRKNIYEILGNLELNNNISDPQKKDFKILMNRTALFGDEQLLSELYTLYSEQDAENFEDRLFYNLKAIEIQSKIGEQYFPILYLRYLVATESLYFTMDYKESIKKGKEALRLIKSQRNNISNYCLLADIIGSSYYELGMADSSIYYYKKIKYALNDYKANYSQYKNGYGTYRENIIHIWRGVLDGGIAKALILQKKYDEAHPLLLENIRSSTETQQWNDVAKAQSFLAHIYFMKENYQEALDLWRNAYKNAEQSNTIKISIEAAKGLAETYKKLNRYDSAYLYNDLFHTHNDDLIKQITYSRLAIVNAKIEHEETQNQLSKAQNIISQQKTVRNFILICATLIILIAFFIYNRYLFRQKVKYERLASEQKLAEMEIVHNKEQIMQAQAQLDTFARNITEKNLLIEKLRSQFEKEKGVKLYAELCHFTILTEENWQEFKDIFEKAHPGFWQRMHKKMPHLTLSEQRYMALSRLGLSNKEMAAATGVSPESIRVVIHRLRKKMDFTEKKHIHNIARSI